MGLLPGGLGMPGRLQAAAQRTVLTPQAPWSPRAHTSSHTAGRLHTQAHLMKELEKIHRVVQRQIGIERCTISLRSACGAAKRER